MSEQPEPQYPLTDQLQLVSETDLRDYLETLFSRVLWKPSHFICLRGIGEKHTPKEGKHQEDLWAQPGLFEFADEQLADQALAAAQTWGQHHIATFIVPAVLREARGRSDAVELFTALVVDLDSGDTNAKSAWLDQHLGTPTMVVASGGVTEAGMPKLHVYYVFDEPSADVGGVVELRHQLALKAGGDLQFGRGTPDNPYGRAHQPIRIPGSVHAKGGKAATCRLLWSRGPVHDHDELGYKIRNAPAGPWAPAATDADVRGAGFDFGPSKNQRPDIGDSLLHEVHEGGEDKTRWSEFNRVAGFNIGLARRGDLSLEQAKADTYGWMLAKMVPAWPEARFEREWHSLLQVDTQKKGPLPAPAVEPTTPLVVSAELGLREWGMHRWTQTKAPPRDFLVDGLVLAGKPHLVVAEGGAGKTFAMLDLCLKVSSAEGDELPVWLGQPVRGRGTVVMVTTEDDADELHRRIESLDPTGLRFRAGDRLIVMPTLNAGGGFTLAERDRAGRAVPSARWMELLSHLERLDGVKLVVVDTLNSTLHGEENSATIINEYMRMLHPVCGRMGAALVLTHHIRKQNNQAGGQLRPIATAEDMFNAIRGSSALPAAFRAVLGIWHSHDYARRLKAMGLEPKAKQLWRFGVLKANNPEMVDDLRFLMRADSGELVDVTRKAIDAVAGQDAQRAAWLTLAVKLAAEAGAPYVGGGKDAPNGLYQRRTELHPCLRAEGFGRTRLLALVEQLITEGTLVTRAVTWSDQRGRKKDMPTLDAAGGPFASGQRTAVDYGATFMVPDGMWERMYSFDPVDGSLGARDRPKLVMAPPRQADSDRQTDDMFDDA
jgi:KaiC/GvpD/RAD55 family RecA-like ATPase